MLYFCQKVATDFAFLGILILSSSNNLLHKPVGWDGLVSWESPIDDVVFLRVVKALNSSNTVVSMLSQYSDNFFYHPNIIVTKTWTLVLSSRL